MHDRLFKVKMMIEDEMTNIIKGSNERTILINLFNVDYNAKEEDIRNIYKDVKINEVTEIKAGIFLLDLDKEEALNIVEIGAKVSIFLFNTK